MVFGCKTVSEVLVFGRQKLDQLENPQLEAEVLLSIVLGKDRTFLKKYPEYHVGFFERMQFRRFIKLRQFRYPMAQILGFKNWADLKIFVSKDVLIPRDETEILVHRIVSELRNFTPKKILDVGTGSGNIAIFCAQKFPEAGVIALDISQSALCIAQKNMRQHKVRIEFLHSDLLQKIDTKSHFDLIIANLPYVPRDVSVSSEVKKEPNLAVFSGEDGLDHIRKFRQQLKSKQISFRELWLEFLPTQASEIQKIFAPYRLTFFPDAGGDIFFAKVY